MLSGLGLPYFSTRIRREREICDDVAAAHSPRAAGLLVDVEVRLSACYWC